MRRLLNRKSPKTEDSSSSRADLALVDRAKEGDDGAFEELVRKYQSRVVGLAYSVVRNTEDALDVAQETFIKAHRNLKGFRKSIRKDGQDGPNKWICHRNGGTGEELW